MFSADHPGEDDGGFTFGGTNATEKMKKVWSSDKFTCCQPTNTVIGDNDPPSMCCSGYAEDIAVTQNDYDRTCKLRDSTDITLLANRYISTLGDELGLEDSDYDPVTGFPTITIDEMLEKLVKQTCVGPEPLRRE